MRAMKMPVMKGPSASFWAEVLARIVAARNAAYDRLCARSEPISNSPSAPESSAYGAVGPGVSRSCWPRSETNTATAGGSANARP